MAKKEGVLLLNAKIKARTEQHYLLNKRACSFENWLARCTAFVLFKKPVWPPVRKKEVGAFFSFVPSARKYWKKAGAKK